MSAHKLFLSEIRKPAEEIEIELCALLFASALATETDVDGTIRSLDEQVNGFLAKHPEYQENAPFNSDYLIGVVGDILGYRGDSLEYFSPDNSLLNRVVETKLGIPISLAAIYVAVGRRLGITVHGVSFPGHFLIRIVEPDGTGTLVDPFSHKKIGKDEQNALVGAATQSFGYFDQSWIANAHPHDFLVRMLENLKNLYLHAKDVGSVMLCLDFQLLLKPDDERFLTQLQALRDNTAGDRGQGRLN
ncbi:MAG: transglutaminase family protein [Rhodobacteraceae bacterium]|nr:transglutaminase family protein [Paracoccaceae bacterium]